MAICSTVLAKSVQERFAYLYTTSSARTKQQTVAMRHIAQYVLLGIGLLFIVNGTAQAQELKLKFEQFTTERGLSQSRVNCIVQDKRGFIWIGTNDGLNRFDGYTFTVYRYSAQNPNSIPSDIIQALYCDRNGTLWIGTPSGLCKSEDGGVTFETFIPDPRRQNSLANEQINVISEDRWGAIWIGTQDGLCKTIDGGKSFLTFKHEERNSKSLSDNEITALCFDSAGTMWVGTRGGLCKSDDGGVSFKTYKHDNSDKNSISSDTVLSISIDKTKNVWIGTANGLCYLNPKTERFVTFFPTLGERFKVFPAVLCDPTSYRLWIGSENGGLWLFNTNTKDKKDWRNYGISSGLTDNQIISLYQDRAGLLWVGTVSGGVYLCNPTGSAKFEAIAVNPKRGDKLVVRKVSAIWEEPDETLLIGTTDAGLYRYLPEGRAYRRLQVGKDESEESEKIAGKKARPQPKKTPPKKRNGKNEVKPATIDLENAHITALLRDKTGMLWIGTTSGLCVQAKEKGALRYFFHYPENPKGLCSNEITALYEDQKGNIWIGTKNGLCYLSKVNKLDTAKGGKMTVFKNEVAKPQTLSSNHITTIFQDRSGAIWVGTNGGGLCKTTDGGNTFKRMLSDPQNPKSLSANTVWALCQDTSKAIWVATDGGGLCRTADGGETFTVFRERDGLSSDIVYSVFEDSEGFIWLKTRKSITKVTHNLQSEATLANTKPVMFRNYDGLSGVQFGLRNSQLQQFDLPASHKGESGYLYFGGNGVINSFSPESFREKSYKPPVIITGVAVKETVGDTERDSILAINEKITLPYKYNKFSIEYSALAYYEQTKNQYAYKLESFEKNWNYAGPRREATYTNLEPGEYTFYVKAAGPDGIWNEEGTKIELEIVPPFWKTWWFRSLATLLGIFSIGGLGYVGYKQRVKAIEARNRELEAKITEATLELREKNKEIQSQKDELEEKNRSITASIEYAKTIQMAILPDKERLKQHLPEHFILYKPRDIVSGDFYWFHEEQGKIIFVVADCTGHGVPGAFMSAIGESLLGQIVIEKNVMNPAKILEELHRLVRRALNQNDEIGGSQDGMDVGIIVMEKSTNPNMRTICFAGARRPLYYTKEGELCEIKPDKSSIGGWQQEAERHYTEHRIELALGEMIYMTTDGYADQPDSQLRVFAAKRLRELLKFIAAKPVHTQLQILEDELKRHQGTEPQRDDITVVGIRIT
jgi:ligand-binding sensor domain-containing protein/serine phosphatase RsbU (regulator of sigma subunit)